MNETITYDYQWMKDMLLKSMHELRWTIHNTAEMLVNPHLDLGMTDEEQMRESALGCLWATLIEEIENTSEATRPLSLPEIKLVCEKEGLTSESVGDGLIITMENHHYSFDDDDGQVKCGPANAEGRRTGWEMVKLTREEFGRFIIEYDKLVPDAIAIMEPLFAKLLAAAKSELIMERTVRSLIIPFLECIEDRYDISVRCNALEEPNTTEIELESLPYFEQTIQLTMKYDEIIANPSKYCETALRVIENKDVANEYDFVKYIEEIR